MDIIFSSFQSSVIRVEFKILYSFLFYFRFHLWKITMSCIIIFGLVFNYLLFCIFIISFNYFCFLKNSNYFNYPKNRWSLFLFSFIRLMVTVLILYTVVISQITIILLLLFITENFIHLFKLMNVLFLFMALSIFNCLKWLLLYLLDLSGYKSFYQLNINF